MAKPPYEQVPYPPFRRGTANPNNSDTYHRRDTHAREMDDDGVSNAAADADYFGNLKKFGTARPGDQQRAEPTRKK